MRDSSPQVDAAFAARFAARSPIERLRMACAMFDEAKALAAADVRARRLDLSPSELRVQIFDRLYLGDFTAAERERIHRALRSEPL